MGTFRIAVLASGTGTNLQAILDGLHGRDGIEVVCVASNKPGARALERAANAGVETGVFPREDHGDRVERDAAMADWLTAREVELIVLAGYMELLSAEFVRRFPKGTNSFRLNDPRLRPGTWRLQLQGTNSVGTGPIAIIHVHVTKHA